VSDAQDGELDSLCHKWHLRHTTVDSAAVASPRRRIARWCHDRRVPVRARRRTRDRRDGLDLRAFGPGAAVTPAAGAFERGNERGIAAAVAVHAPSDRVPHAPHMQDGELDSVCNRGAFVAQLPRSTSPAPGPAGCCHGHRVGVRARRRTRERWGGCNDLACGPWLSRARNPTEGPRGRAPRRRAHAAVMIRRVPDRAHSKATPSHRRQVDIPYPCSAVDTTLTLSSHRSLETSPLLGPAIQSAWRTLRESKQWT
jgi:hypothetical protein